VEDVRRRALKHWSGVILLALAPFACGTRADHEPVDLLPGDYFDVYADGDALQLLALGESGLLYRRSDDAGVTWADAVPPDFLAEASAPFGHEVRVAARGKRVVALWATRGTGFEGSGPLVSALSADGGRTWRLGPNPADDGSTEGHGFIDVFSSGDAFHTVWLDGRDGSQGLRYARSAEGTRWEANVSIDAETCECCWNTLAATQDDLYVLYRDKAPRDMAIAVSEDHGESFRRLGFVGEFDWLIEACPHVGGGMVASDETLHTVVWTGRDGAVGIYYLRSLDGGSTWSAPFRLGDESARHADIAVSDEGRLAIVWDATEDERRRVRTVVSPDGGKSWAAPMATPYGGRSNHHPRVVATSRGFMAFWSAVAAEEQVIVGYRLSAY
jgi:hypothetical protein